MQKEEAIKLIQGYFTEGDRYNFLLSLSGSFAKLGLPQDYLIEIYQKYLKPNDDEDRTKLIITTYERYFLGKPIRTLLSIGNPDYYKEIHKLLRVIYNPILQHNTGNSTININNTEFTPLKENELYKYVMPLDPVRDRLHYKYLLGRGLPEDCFHQFRLYVGIGENRDRVCFVSRNSDGDIVSIIGRSILDNSPRYKVIFGNPSYSLWNYKDTLMPRVVCEGVFDAMTVELHIANVNAVALLGKNISPTQTRLLRNSTEITFILDSDVPRKQISALVNKVWIPTIPIYIVTLPSADGKCDPNSLGIKIKEFFQMRKRVWTKGGMINV